jgi:hypothetical protein
MVTEFNAKVSISSEVMIRHVGGESVVLDLKSERYLGLDEIATQMWQALTSSESIEAAYTALLTEYDVTGERLRADLDDFVQELLQLGLIELGNQS